MAGIEGGFEIAIAIIGIVTMLVYAERWFSRQEGRRQRK